MNPRPFPLRTADAVDAAAFERSLVEAGAVDHLTAGTAYGTWLAGAGLARLLAGEWQGEEGHWPAALELDDGSGNHRHALVVTEQSSMEPRGVWPVSVPVADLDAWDFDLVMACYVPKRTTIELPGSPVDPVAWLVGWLPAHTVRQRDRMEIEPHAGQRASAVVHQMRCSDLHDPTGLPAVVFTVPTAAGPE